MFMLMFKCNYAYIHVYVCVCDYLFLSMPNYAYANVYVYVYMCNYVRFVSSFLICSRDIIQPVCFFCVIDYLLYAAPCD